MAALVAVLSSIVFSCRKQAPETVPVMTLKSVLITYEGKTQFLNIAAESSWSLTIEYEGAQEGWLALDETAGTGTGAVALKCARNDGEDTRYAIIWLKTRTHLVSQPVVQGAKTPVVRPGWMELPELDREGLDFLTHAMDGSKYRSEAVSGVRNWSFYYDYAAFVSHWVAYPLNKGLIGSGSRTNAWGLDPILPASAQCTLISNSYGGGWTRGHQIPSADRLNYAANVSTFYGTNMTPQEYDFNSYIWAALEGQVRTYAGRCDTLYVVTGCDVRNSTRWSGTNGGHAAKVPTHYYKALLRKKGDAYSAVGFYLPHDQGIARGDYMDYLCSISDLEAKTGVTFFANYTLLYGTEKSEALKKADPAATVKNW